MKAYVINLANSPERRVKIEEQLRRLGLEYEIVEAVDGRVLTPADRLQLVDEAAVAASDGWLTPGQIGCSLSHRRVFERVVAANHKHALVLEDDAVLPPSLPGLLPEVAAVVDAGEVALLNFRSWKPCRFTSEGARPLVNGFRLMRPVDGAQLVSSAAYVVTADAAAKLQDGVVPVYTGADSWGRFLEDGLITAIWCVLPRPVGVETAFSSTIDYLPATNKAAKVKRLAERPVGLPLRLVLHQIRAARERRMSRVIVQDGPAERNEPEDGQPH